MFLRGDNNRILSQGQDVTVADVIIMIVSEMFQLAKTLEVMSQLLKHERPSTR
jgi:hypothetical protein